MIENNKILKTMGSKTDIERCTASWHISLKLLLVVYIKLAENIGLPD